MALQNFVNFVGPAISAAWLNAVDVIKTTILGDAATKADARTALTSDAPLEVVNGGTGVRSVPELVDLIGGDISLPSQTGHAYARLFTNGTNAAWETTNVYHVNDFGAVGDGTSHPLSTRFATLGEAQAVYPCATALTDEIDWCAWQTAIDVAYQRDYNVGYNASTARLIADGKYIVNRTISCYLYQVEVEGTNQPSNFTAGHSTWIKYNGIAGTVDAPVYIFDFCAGDEDGTPPVGIPGTAGGSAGYCRIRNMGFAGKYVDSIGMPGAPSATDFVSAVRLRYCNFGEISHCSFFNSLYDGIRYGLSMFSTVRNNFFYGCQRDALAYYAIKSNFSTTIWIDDNEFGYVGRYAVCIDVTGSVQPSITARRNDVECTYNSYYVSHPEWFVHGVVAPWCVIGADSPTCRFEDNRFEGVQFYNGIWADWHFAACSQLILDNNMCFGTVFTTNTPQIRTTDGINFINANGFFDITDTRNYRIGTSGSFIAANQSFIIKNSFGGVIIFADGVGFGSSGTQTVIENQQLIQISVPVVDRPNMDGKMLGTPLGTVPSLHPISNVLLKNVLVTAGIYGYCTGLFHHYVSSTLIGDIAQLPVAFYTWSSGQACRADCDTNGGGGAVGNWIGRRKWVVPTNYNGYIYECIVTGVTGGSEPVWPTTLGNTVVDNTVTWKCISYYGLPSAYGGRECLELGRRRVTVDGAPPTTGRWNYGDTAINRLPEDGKAVAWVCAAAGLPGTWIPSSYMANTAPTTVALADTATIVQSSGGLAKKASMQKLKDIIYLKPINSQSGNYVLVALDSGQTVLHPNGAGAGHTFTIPANSSVSYPLGVELEIINEDSNALSIAITSDTMTLEGSTTTGTRTLGQNGRARARKTSATTWLITGTALT